MRTDIQYKHFLQVNSRIDINVRKVGYTSILDWIK